MSNGFALWKGNSRDIDWGRLVLDDGGILTLETGAGSTSVAISPDAAPYLDVYVSEDWLCAVGGADRALVLGHAQPLRLSVVADLPRLGHTDQGFEFETHSVRFRDRPRHDQCLLAWELGVALIDPDVGLVWTHEHHDVNQRVMRVTEHRVELRGVYRAVSISLADGSAEVTSSQAPAGLEDGETLAEWMRGIGR